MGPPPTGVVATWQPTLGRYASVCAPSNRPGGSATKMRALWVRTQHAAAQLILRATQRRSDAATQRRRASPAGGPWPVLNDCFAARISASRMSTSGRQFLFPVFDCSRSAVSSFYPLETGEGQVSGWSGRSTRKALTDRSWQPPTFIRQIRTSAPSLKRRSFGSEELASKIVASREKFDFVMPGRRPGQPGNHNSLSFWLLDHRDKAR